MTQVEEINEIAKTLDIPENEMSAFRIGYYLGKVAGIEEVKEIHDKIYKPAKILEDVTD